MAITLRRVKLSALTHDELDDNFEELENGQTSAAAITGGTISGITDLDIADGGTGASTASDARINLGIKYYITGGAGPLGWSLGTVGYASLNGETAFQAVETENLRQIIGIAGTVSVFGARKGADNASGDVIVSLLKNGTAIASVTFPAGPGANVQTDTSSLPTIAAGDAFSIKVDPTAASPGGFEGLSWYLAITPS